MKIVSHIVTRMVKLEMLVGVPMCFACFCAVGATLEKTLKDPTTSGLRVDQYPTAIISGFTPQKIGDGPPNEDLLVKPAVTSVMSCLSTIISHRNAR